MYTGSLQNTSFGSGNNSVWPSEIQAREICVIKGVGVYEIHSDIR